MFSIIIASALVGSTIAAPSILRIRQLDSAPSCSVQCLNWKFGEAEGEHLLFALPCTGSQLTFSLLLLFRPLSSLFIARYLNFYRFTLTSYSPCTFMQWGCRLCCESPAIYEHLRCSLPLKPFLPEFFVTQCLCNTQSFRNAYNTCIGYWCERSDESLDTARSAVDDFCGGLISASSVAATLTDTSAIASASSAVAPASSSAASALSSASSSAASVISSASSAAEACK